MGLDVRPRVEEFWKRIGLAYQPARNGVSKRYTGNLIVHGHCLRAIIEEHQNGTTSTWVYDPPSKLKSHHCVNEGQGSWPGQGWYVVHYKEGCPTTVREAVNALGLIVNKTLGKGSYSSQQISGTSNNTFWKRSLEALRQALISLRSNLS